MQPPNDLSFFGNVHSLDELHLKFEADGEDSRTARIEYQHSVDFLKAVVRITKGQERLKTIVVETIFCSCGVYRIREQKSGVKLGTLPYWKYMRSLSKSNERRPWNFQILEMLERIQ